MPKIAIYKFLVFFIVSYDLNERYHLHIVNSKSRKTKAAKIWLDPTEVFEKGDLKNSEIKLAIKLIEENKKDIIHKINNFAEGKKSKPLNLDK